MKPIFSLCHTTARLPDGWRKAAQAWLDNCDDPSRVEHILTFDEPTDVSPIFPNTITGLNTGPHTAVAGWNLAAKLSSGQFIISLADDWFPCPHWDTELLKVIPDLNAECVIEVDTGGDVSILTFSMLTRAYLNRYSKGEGWLFYPEYTGMYADNDFTDSAKLDKVIVNARHLQFLHRHPNYFADVEPDAVHLWQGRSEAWRIGIRVYKKRCAQKGLKIRPILAVCLPGETFSSTWVAYLITLMNFLQRKFTVSPILTFSSNVHVTRASLARNIVKSIPLPDYVLWLDDDNLLSAEHFSMLFESLENTPAADMMAGWAWVRPDVYDGDNARTSVGMFGPDGKGIRLSYPELMEGKDDVREVHYSGFPTVLMRGEMLEKAGPNPFIPIVDPAFEWGFASEDVSFCIHAREQGCRIFVDRRVRVPHLKLRDAVPSNFLEALPAPTEQAPSFASRRDERAKELAATR